MTEPVIVPHPNTIRGPIESEHNGLRDAREEQYITDKVALEADYHADLVQIQSDKQDAMVAAGLNPDGGIPSDYPDSVPSGNGGGGPSVPANTDLPVITGTAQVGEELTVSTGTWSGTPDSYTYEWQKDVDGDVTVVGADQATYTVDSEVGATIRCRVSATNDAGTSDPVAAAWTSAVEAGGTAPVNTVLPEITGADASVGTVVHGSDGTWTGQEPITFSYHWLRKVGESYTTLSGETASDYTLTTDDIDAQLLFRVLATNPVDNHQVDSELYGPIIA